MHFVKYEYGAFPVTGATQTIFHKNQTCIFCNDFHKCMWWVDPGQQLSTTQPLAHSGTGERITRAKAESSCVEVKTV